MILDRDLLTVALALRVVFGRELLDRDLLKLGRLNLDLGILLVVLIVCAFHIVL